MCLLECDFCRKIATFVTFGYIVSTPLPSSPHSAPHPPLRNARIDFLRGAAIFVVLALHFALSFGIPKNPLFVLLPPALLPALAFNGNYGVTIFFAVSGFLITRGALARWGRLQDIDVRAFYLLRFARIVPGLLLALAIIIALGSMGLPSFTNDDGGQVLGSAFFGIAALSILTFWHNVLMQSTGYFNYCLNVYWSLSVEEMFYLALPLICLGLRRTWLVAAVCVALIVAAPIYRSQHIDNEIYYMYGYWAAFDAIAFGCLAALLARHTHLSPLWQRLLRLGAGVLLAAVYLRGIQGHEVAGFSLIAFASAAFLLGAANDTRAGWLTGRLSSLPRWAGRHSYEIYLFHIIVLGLMRNVFKKPELSAAMRLPWFVLFLVLTALAAALVARFVTEPGNAAIRAWYAARRPPAIERAVRTE